MRGIASSTFVAIITWAVLNLASLEAVGGALLGRFVDLVQTPSPI